MPERNNVYPYIYVAIRNQSPHPVLLCTTSFVKHTLTQDRGERERETNRQTDRETGRSSSPHERRRESRARGPDCQTERYNRLRSKAAHITFTAFSHNYEVTEQI
jgi:hypothetical protein